MNKHVPAAKLQELSVSERLQLIEDVWASLCESPETVDVPDWHRAELDKRLAAHERDPGAATPWDEVKADILASLRK